MADPFVNKTRLNIQPSQPSIHNPGEDPFVLRAIRLSSEVLPNQVRPHQVQPHQVLPNQVQPNEVQASQTSQTMGEMTGQTIGETTGKCNADPVTSIRQFCSEIPPGVRIIAVTKQVSIDLMRSAYEAGIRDFGENRVQEALQKQQALQDLRDVTWHFIGHLQSNKALKVVQHFDWIQSIDTLALAQRINRLAQDNGKIVQGCVQVKLRPDETKSGWSVEALRESMAQLTDFSALQIRGLMLIPPARLNTTELSTYFQEAAALAQELQLKDLSMGMSGDYPIAIQSGATMIRPGRALFGQRPEIPTSSPPAANS